MESVQHLDGFSTPDDRRRYHNPLCALFSTLGGGDYYQHVRAIVSAFRDVQFCGGISSLPGVSSSPQKVLITMEAKQITNFNTVLMISFCSTDDIVHLSLLLGSILPMEVLPDFQDGGILEFGDLKSI